MPGTVARTSTFALCNATLPSIRRLANEGIDAALVGDAGLNVRDGEGVHGTVAAALSRVSKNVVRDRFA
jgi:alanine dehydrogenase